MNADENDRIHAPISDSAFNSLLRARLQAAIEEVDFDTLLAVTYMLVRRGQGI